MNSIWAILITAATIASAVRMENALPMENALTSVVLFVTTRTATVLLNCDTREKPLCQNFPHLVYSADNLCPGSQYFNLSIFTWRLALW
ncbi:hypothetical protein FE257_011122 [Aspergillus nanangensis]|uniref:Uncharacterized protein n=1 Tax=Aspergillus nanangensis TaxID=2582783 RepID=A0AAD4CHT6_ASPNN|nr:hypothetical protein FE257_011122 [Aspergillus nanangensis]